MKRILLFALFLSSALSWADFVISGGFSVNRPPPRPHHHHRARHYPSHMFISTSKAKFIATSAVGGGKVVNLLLRQGAQIYEATVQNDEGEFLVIIEALNGKLLDVLKKN